MRLLLVFFIGLLVGVSVAAALLYFNPLTDVDTPPADDAQWLLYDSPLGSNLFLTHRGELPLRSNPDTVPELWESTIDGTVAHSLRAARSNSEERIVFSLIDIDHFKSINDRWGHDAGDEILQQFARRLSELRRGEEPLVRWGGEEFLLVSRVDRMDAAWQLAERLRRAIADEPFHLQDGRDLELSCSVGCAPLVPDSTGTVFWQSVVSLADKALYDAKASGRNAWVGVALAAGVRYQDLEGRLHERLDVLTEEGLVEAIRPPRFPPLRGFT